MKKYILIFLTLLFFLFLYNKLGIETNKEIASLSLKPEHDIIAIAVVEKTKRYPIINLSGWSRGVPDTIKMEGEIYFYNIKEKEIKKISSVKIPKDWSKEGYNLSLYIWDKDGVYFTLENCFNRNCEENYHYFLEKNGKIKNIKSLPKLSKSYSESIREKTVYKTYQNNELNISIGKSGDWKPVLVFRDGKLEPIY